MKDFINFFHPYINKIKQKNLSFIAHAMTYQLLLALFPILLFIMTIAGFLDLDLDELIHTMDGLVPAEVVAVIEMFGEQVIGVQMAGLLYASLAMAIFSSTSALRTLVSGINKAHGITDSRHPVLVWFVSFLLVIIFITAIVLTMVGFVFRIHIRDFMLELNIVTYALIGLYNIFVVTINIVFVMAAVLFANYVSLCRKIPLKNLLPGSILTVIVWIAASYGFSYFVNNFSSMVTIYGSVAAVMVLMIWLNIICQVLLFGGAINAVLMEPAGPAILIKKQPANQGDPYCEQKN